MNGRLEKQISLLLKHALYNITTMAKYNIFISYRRVGTADKAEHLLSLLEESGYKGKVSFDRENFDGTFDLEILQRIDKCKDFILVIGENTFTNVTMEDAGEYRYYAQCSITEFDSIQRKLQAEGKTIDFVRFEIARALEKGKNIIPIVPSANEKFDFDRLKLPEDICQIKRIQAVFYNDSKNFLFKSIIPDIIRRLKTPRLRFLKISLSILATAILIMAGFLFTQYNKYIDDLNKCRTATQYELFLEKDLPGNIRNKAEMALAEIDSLKHNYVYPNDGEYGYTTYGKLHTDSLMVFWSEDLSYDQLLVIRQIFNNMMLVNKGSFTMGTDNYIDIDGPSHKVTLTDDFYISKYELTKKEWFSIISDSTITTQDSLVPVTSISWNECMDFTKQLNNLVATNEWEFSIPTEAQWEYAAKGGENFVYAGSNNLEKVMNINTSQAVDVGQSNCNGFGLYDMTGNVKEWCLDGDWRVYDKNDVTDPIGKITAKKHIIRGGSYLSKDNIDFLKLSYRDTYSSDLSSEDIGLRLVLIKKK